MGFVIWNIQYDIISIAVNNAVADIKQHDIKRYIQMLTSPTYTILLFKSKTMVQNLHILSFLFSENPFRFSETQVTQL